MYRAWCIDSESRPTCIVGEALGQKIARDQIKYSRRHPADAFTWISFVVSVGIIVDLQANRNLRERQTEWCSSWQRMNLNERRCRRWRNGWCRRIHRPGRTSWPRWRGGRRRSIGCQRAEIAFVAISKGRL